MVNGLSLRSKSDLLQKDKQVQTYTYPFIEKERAKGGIKKKAGQLYSQ